MGFAMGNGRRRGGGVRGAAGAWPGFCMGAGSGVGSMIVGMGFGNEDCGGEADESSAGLGSLSGM